MTEGFNPLPLRHPDVHFRPWDLPSTINREPGEIYWRDFAPIGIKEGKVPIVEKIFRCANTLIEIATTDQEYCGSIRVGVNKELVVCFDRTITAGNTFMNTGRAVKMIRDRMSVLCNEIKAPISSDDQEMLKELLPFMKKEDRVSILKKMEMTTYTPDFSKCERREILVLFPEYFLEVITEKPTLVDDLLKNDKFSWVELADYCVYAGLEEKFEDALMAYSNIDSLGEKVLEFKKVATEFTYKEDKSRGLWDTLCLKVCICFKRVFQRNRLDKVAKELQNTLGNSTNTNISNLVNQIQLDRDNWWSMTPLIGIFFFTSLKK